MTTDIQSTDTRSITWSITWSGIDILVNELETHGLLILLGTMTGNVITAAQTIPHLGNMTEKCGHVIMIEIAK